MLTLQESCSCGSCGASCHGGDDKDEDEVEENDHRDKDDEVFLFLVRRKFLGE